MKECRACGYIISDLLAGDWNFCNACGTKQEKNAQITYEKIYETLKKEKYNEDLQKLNNNLFEEAKILLNRRDLTTQQLDNIRKILKELYERRENKIVQAAIMSSRLLADNLNYNNMTSTEIKLYFVLQENFVHYKKETIPFLFRIQQGGIK